MKIVYNMKRIQEFIIMRKLFLILLAFFTVCPMGLAGTTTITVPTGYYYNRPYYGNTYYHNRYPTYTTTTVYPKTYTNPTVYNPNDVLISKSYNGTTKIITPRYTTRTYSPYGRTKVNYYTPSYSNTYIPMRFGY
ncbi:hypothetical protein IJ596_00980 [bacterium]|nr:hypothetical protein [bacterium]